VTLDKLSKLYESSLVSYHYIDRVKSVGHVTYNCANRVQMCKA